MTADLFLVVSENVALCLLAVAVALSLIRLVRGPSVPDRILALDLLTTLAISLIGVLTLRTGVSLQLDIALALCLVGFVATIALARYVVMRAAAGAEAGPPETGGDA
jgi:multicomponent Na+:H+ antiporter subunit F